MGSVPCKPPPNCFPEPEFVKVYGALIDSEESIPPAYVAYRAGTTDRVVVPARQAGRSIPGLLKRCTNTGSFQMINDDIYVGVLV